jgi:hypothetical protein
MGAVDAEMMARILAGKIRELPAAYITELEEFIDTLVKRAQGTPSDRDLRRRAAQASERSFSAVWDNPEDDVYDTL